jgi:glutaconate CoA-transferase subunit B
LSALRRYLGSNPGIEKSEMEKTSNRRSLNIDYAIISAAECIKDNGTVATGVASPIPMIAIIFAKLCGKRFTYINCTAGAVNPALESYDCSSAAISALEKKEYFLELSQAFDYGLSGKIDAMFFGAAQIAKNGDINLSCIGDYEKPKVKLAGPAGAVTMRNLCKNPVIISLQHSKKTFVDKVDFVTSGITKDTVVITNLGVLKLGKNPEILEVYPCSSIEEIRQNTGFELKYDIAKTAKKISEEEIKLLDSIDRKYARYK